MRGFHSCPCGTGRGCTELDTIVSAQRKVRRRRILGLFWYADDLPLSVPAEAKIRLVLPVRGKPGSRVLGE
jgi:hypothetical protein